MVFFFLVNWGFIMRKNGTKVWLALIKPQISSVHNLIHTTCFVLVATKLLAVVEILRAVGGCNIKS